MLQKHKEKIIVGLLLLLIIIINMGWLDIPQTDEGIIIKKERLWNGDFGIFTVQLENRKFPKTVTYDRMPLTAFEVGDRILIHYKLPINFIFNRPYGVGHELIE